VIEDMDKTNHPFDQNSRYLETSKIIKRIFKNEKIKILDVGGLSRLWHSEETFRLINLFLPESETFTVDLKWNNERGFIQADSLKIPFKDSSFHAVCALDILEHIEKKQRNSFLNEIYRVSSDVVILSSPILNKKTERAEKILKDFIKRTLGVDQAELKDHLEKGLPDFQSTLNRIKKLSRDTFHFSIGNIENWLFFMTLKYSLMYKLSWIFINRFMDAYFNTHYYETEFKEPCYRNIIVSTKKEPVKAFLEVKDHYSMINKKAPGTAIGLENFEIFGRHLERAFAGSKPSLFSEVTLSVIVVTYNSEEYIERCLSFLEELAPKFKIELIVVDNGSENSGLDKIKRVFPQAIVKINDKNLGYARAANLGILNAAGKYLLLINPDCYVKSTEIMKMIDYFEANPQVGIVGPKILNPDGSVQGTARSFPNAWTALFGRNTLLSRLFPGNKFTRKNVVGSSMIKKPMEVDWVSGVMMGVRKEAVLDAGLMDENFFLYWEDADWCTRFRHESWKVVYNPEAKAEHSTGASTSKRKLRSIIDFHKSAYVLYRKYSIKKWNLIKKFLAVTCLSLRAFLLLTLNATFPKKRVTPKIKKIDKNRLNILHLVHNYHPAIGGVEKLMQNISERLHKRGHRVKVVTSNALSVEDYTISTNEKKLLPVGKETINNVEVERVPFSKRNQALWRFLYRIFWYLKLPGNAWIRALWQGPRAKGYIRAGLRSHCDVICACPLPTRNVYYAQLLKKKKKCPLVVIPCIHTEDRFGYHNRLFYKILREANAVIALTSLEKDFLIEAGVDPDKIFVSGVGIEENFQGEEVDIRKKHGIQEKNIVLFVGQHGIHKGIDSLIKAMDYVWQEKKETALIIAGSPTANSRRIAKLIQKYSREKRKKIYMIDSFSEEEKESIYKSADVFVSVSKYESFGIVFLEAWLNKVPVISCRSGASSTLVDNLRDGLHVEYDNHVELGSAILELLNDGTTRKKMGEAGYRKVKENYTWPHIIDEIEEVYKKA
jgi:GT2 family glycosyltransferase